MVYVGASPEFMIFFDSPDGYLVSFHRGLFLTVLQNRPGYESTKANEFVDKPEVLASKVKILAKLITTSKNFTIYSGAGISTAAGLDDYASRAEQSLAIGGMPKVRSHFDTEPTLAHYCLTSLFKAGYVPELSTFQISNFSQPY